MPRNDRFTVFHDDGTRGRLRKGKVRGESPPGGYIGSPLGKPRGPHGRRPGQIARGRQ